MLRTIVVPHAQDISLHIPKEFVGKEVEIIAFPVEVAVVDRPLTYLASEASLAKDWLSPEDEAAWENL